MDFLAPHGFEDLLPEILKIHIDSGVELHATAAPVLPYT